MADAATHEGNAEAAAKRGDQKTAADEYEKAAQARDAAGDDAKAGEDYAQAATNRTMSGDTALSKADHAKASDQYEKAGDAAKAAAEADDAAAAAMAMAIQMRDAAASSRRLAKDALFRARLAESMSDHPDDKAMDKAVVQELAEAASLFADEEKWAAEANRQYVEAGLFYMKAAVLRGKKDKAALKKVMLEVLPAYAGADAASREWKRAGADRKKAKDDEERERKELK